MATRTQAEKCEAFARLHREPGAFLIPRPWDVGSARLLEEKLAHCAERFRGRIGNFLHEYSTPRAVCAAPSPKQHCDARSPAIRGGHLAFCAPQSVDVGLLKSEVVEDPVLGEPVAPVGRLRSLISREDTGKPRVPLSTVRA